MTLKKTVLALTLLGATVLTNTSVLAEQKFDAAQQKQIEQIVQNYLLKNPQILVQMSENLQQQQMKKVANIEKQAQAVIPKISKQLFNAQTSPVSGNANGQITLVEFFDYQCPHCKDMAKIIEEISTKNPKLRIVYKEFPIFGGASDFAAKAALAANMQNKYLSFHNALMQTQGRLTDQQILDIAKQDGINIKQLQDDMKSPAVTKELKQNIMLAGKLKLPGTPAFVVGPTDKKKASDSILIPGQTSANILEKVIEQVQQKMA